MMKMNGWTTSLFLVYILLKSNAAMAQKPSTEQAVSDSLRNSLMELKWSEKEVSNVARLIGGRVYLNRHATEKMFKTEAPRAGIIHLATHALIDDQYPMDSKFVFAVDNDSTEDGFLHTYELYNMQLQAELAVLSACNTGTGRLSEGEGILSLARSFIYAGVPSVVMSLWPVDDKSTAILLSHFYENLKKGRDKDEALRNAKLKFLENADAVNANPFYWSGLVSIGNSRPIASNLSFWWLAWICFIVGLGVVLLNSARRNFPSFIVWDPKVNFRHLSTIFKTLLRIFQMLVKYDKAKMIILIPFSFLLLFFAFPSYHLKPLRKIQSNFFHSDTMPANGCHRKAEALFQSAQFDSALYYFDIAGQIYQKEKDWIRLIAVHCRMSHILGLNGKHQEALNYLKADLASGLEKLGEGHPAIAELYHIFGELCYFGGKYDEALQFYAKSLSIRLEKIGKDDPTVGALYNDMAEVYIEKANFGRAEECLQKSLTINRSRYGEKHAVVAINYNNMGNLLCWQGKYNQARECCQKALSILRKNPNGSWLETASCYQNLGIIYKNIGDYQHSLEYLNQALSIRLRILDDSSPLLGYVFANLGLISFENKDFKKFKKSCHKALSIFVNCYNADHPFVAVIYNMLAVGSVMQSDYTQALEYYHKALDITLKAYGEKHPRVARIYHNLGHALYSLGDSQQALEYYHKGLTIQEQILGRHHPENRPFYNNMGNVYYFIGDYDEALEYYHKALGLSLETASTQIPAFMSRRKQDDNALEYCYIGNVYAGKRDYSRALEYYHKSLSIYLQAVGDNHISTALPYGRLAALYSDMGDYDKALIYLHKSLVVQQRTFGENHPRLAQTYMGIGNTYLATGQYHQSLVAYQKGLALSLKSLGEKHFVTADFYSQLGKIYSKQDQPEKALSYFQKALMAGVYDFNDTSIYRNPALQNIFREKSLMAVLESKAEALEKLYLLKSKRIDDLRHAVATYLLASELIDQIRAKYQTDGSKIRLGEIASRTYRKGIATTWRLFEISNDPNDRELAFLLAEKSRAIVLLETQRQFRVQQFAGVPDSLLVYERKIRIFRTFYNKSFADELEKGEAADSSKIKIFREKLFSLQQEYEALGRKFETEYPDYHRLKYDVSTVSPRMLQDNVLEPNAALLEYVLGDSSVYIFTMTNHHFDMTEVKSDSTLRRRVERFREALSKQDYAQYTRLAYSLYKTLIAPVEAKIKNKRLIIIPDGVLGYLPFEALITRKPTSQKEDYYQLAYLLKDYQINYAYSATLFYDSMTKVRSTKSADYVGFAPVRFN